MPRALHLALILSALATQSGAQGLRNGDFEEGEPGEDPPGWFMPGMLREAGYRLAVEGVNASPPSGEQCAVLFHRSPAGGSRFANVMQVLDATPYQGQRVRLTASVRLAPGAPGARVQLWLRVDRPGGQMGCFENMAQRPITATSWQEYSIVGEVDADAVQLNVGAMHFGGGRAWIDAVSLEVLGATGEGDEGPAPLSPRGLANLQAFTRVLGYVRYFHPSDEAAACDWDHFTIEAVRRVEPARDAEQLARVLSDIFQPLAPTVRVYATGSMLPAVIPESRVPQDRTVEGLVAWRHLGVQMPRPPQAGGGGIYESTRVRERLRRGTPPETIPPLGTAVTRELPGGVSCRVPLCLQYDEQGSLPPPAGEPLVWDRPESWSPTPRDRATRLAAVCLAWNVFQHFYPYFDVVETDWEQALVDALTQAGTDEDAASFLRTLQRLVAALHDGHGNVHHPGVISRYFLPLALAPAEGHVVVTATGTPEVARGDVLLALDGRSVMELIAEAEELISGATAGWRRAVAVDWLLRREGPAPVTLEIEDATGERRRVNLPPGPPAGLPREERPEKIQELEPGLWYVDLSRITDADFAGALARLHKAEGIVFDLRGYPGNLSTLVLAHLTSRTLQSPQWHVPVVTRPDREDLRFNRSGWPVAPRPPRLEAKVAFLTGAQAISYAETYLGIVSHYHLGEIVGATTAGTNGNVNPFTLPGGYGVVWTGMKVLTQDGKQHHGVGIRPTVPVERTIAGIRAGRDEVLDRALEVVAP